MKSLKKQNNVCNKQKCLKYKSENKFYKMQEIQLIILVQWFCIDLFNKLYILKLKNSFQELDLKIKVKIIIHIQLFECRDKQLDQSKQAQLINKLIYITIKIQNNKYICLYKINNQLINKQGYMQNKIIKYF
ncbi:hypothetical protein TTHERM_000310659 (macronuclear) [Tetrahymena thermophila SB210]|uniref:Uncharacterized protein n=1 Tax=Tetrahymena thermophila (strain SB210) TaxID=312017 RepID=W7X1N9_TETTS|nr:hypothetical protein TTHERM_000310659 [Tetrahymena thermophila SB210]EWS73160.1 hypothetical protein TTHERM_000310659 [Tetrahymena thermophila SB210]|eukprot:XP_012654347.1 hypothetical protein TTHERM_000310659 [Tetrahymena thermophila SB210]